MQFLRTLFWVVLAVVGVIFSLGNWSPVTVNLWSGIVVDTHLPVLMLMSFAVGLLPMLLIYKTSRWRFRQRLESANRALIEGRPIEPAPVATAHGMPPHAVPITPPPGVA